MDVPLPLAGRYRFLRERRGTSTGVLWLASDSVSGHTVIVSSITLARAAGLREAIGLTHPQMAPVVDLFEDVPPAQIPGNVALRPGTAVGVAQHVGGQTLHERLEQGALSMHRAVAVLVSMATTMRFLHSNACVHGAVSPRSIISARNDGGPTPVLTNLQAAANGAYCSPDRVRGGGPSSEDDTWALYATLFAALTGEAPFHGRTRIDLANAILSGRVPALSRYGVYDDDLHRVLQSGLDPTLATRSTSVEELEQALVAWQLNHPPPRPLRRSAAPLHFESIVPPPIDDEGVAEGHRSASQENSVQDGGFVRVHPNDGVPETLRVPRSNASAEAIAVKDLPSGDGSELSLSAQLETEEVVPESFAESAEQGANATTGDRSSASTPKQRHSVEVAFVDRADGASVTAEGSAAPQQSEKGEADSPSDPVPLCESSQDRDSADSVAPQTEDTGSGSHQSLNAEEPSSSGLAADFGSNQEQSSSVSCLEELVIEPSPASVETPLPAKRSVIWLVVAGATLTLVVALISFFAVVFALTGAIPDPFSATSRSAVPLPTVRTGVGAVTLDGRGDNLSAPGPSASTPTWSTSRAATSAPVAPLSSDELSACAMDAFPKWTFIRKPEFAFICNNDNPRKAAVMLHRQLVWAGAGTVTMGMKIWSGLSWYELAVTAIIRDACCVGAKPLQLPEPGPPCSPMTDALNDVIRGGCSLEEAQRRSERFAQAVNCLFEHKQPRPYRYRGMVGVIQRQVFEGFLQQLPDKYCSSAK